MKVRYRRGPKSIARDLIKRNSIGTVSLSVVGKELARVDFLSVVVM